VSRGSGASAWRGGWFEPARRCPSPNFGARPAGSEVDLAVIHSISLPPGRYGGDGIERLFTNRLDWSADPYYGSIRGAVVSAHFLVRRDGVVVQFVSVLERAWHAGQSVWRGRADCNDFSVGIELEGLEDEAFETAQYISLARLIDCLADVLPIAHVAGHEHVAPGRKRDPGRRFDWAHLRHRVGAGGLDFAA